MKSFERNTTRKGLMLFLLAVNTLCLLYCAHWVSELQGWVFIVGLLMLLVWIVVVFSEEVRILIYDAQIIYISADGILVGKGKHSKQILWEEIREVEVRDAVGVGTSNWGNTCLVFSKHILSNPLRAILCSDLGPWIRGEGIVEFRYASIENDDGTITFMKQKCPLFSKVMEQPAGRSLSYANADHAGSDSLDHFSDRIQGAKTFSSIMILRDFLWFWTILLSQWELSDTQNTIFGLKLLIILWLFAILCALGCILYRRKLLLST